MQILGFGGVGGVRSGGGYHWGGRGVVWGSGDRAHICIYVYVYICIYVFMYICICTCVYMYIWING